MQARLSPVGTTVVSLRRLRETPQVPLTLEPSEGLEDNWAVSGESHPELTVPQAATLAHTLRDPSPIP